MAEPFNSYREWLGWRGDATPDHYQLLSLAAFEADAEAIAIAGDRAASKVRSFRPGAQAREWSRLLDEIHAAKECLLDPQRKAQYDAALRGEASPPAGAAAVTPRMTSSPSKAADDSDLFPPGMRAERPSAAQPARTEQPAPSVEPAPTPLASGAGPMQPPFAAPAQAASLPSPYAAPAPPYPASLPYAPQPAAGGWAAGPSPAYDAPAGYQASQYPAAPYPSPGYPAPGVAYGLPAAMPAAGLPMALPAGGHAPVAGAYGMPAGYYSYPGGYGGGYAAYPSAAPPAVAPPVSSEPVWGGNSPAAQDPMAPVSIPVGAIPQATLWAAPGSALPPSGLPMGAAVAPASAELPVGTAIAPATSKPATALPEATATKSMEWPDPAEELAAERKRQNRFLVAAVGTGAVLVAAIIGGVIVANQQRAAPLAQNKPAEANPDELQPIARTVESELPGTASKKATPKATARPTEPPKSPDVAPPAPMPPVSAPPPMPAPPMPAPPMPEPMPPATPPAPLPMPAPPTPAPPPVPAPAPPPMVTRAEVTALIKALTTVKEALGEQNFEEADQQLARAETLAKLPKHQEAVARLRQVAGYVKQFRDAVAAAVTQFEAGSVFMVGTSTQVAVVEGFPDRVILRIAGMNKVYPFRDMPPGLAVAIADKKLDGTDPVSRVVKGAYLLVHKRADSESHDKAKTWWKEAQDGGVDMSQLMPFLTENYDDFLKDAGDEVKSPPAAGEKPTSK